MFFFKNKEYENYVMWNFEKLTFSLHINTRIHTRLIIEFILYPNNKVTLL